MRNRGGLLQDSHTFYSLNLNYNPVRTLQRGQWQQGFVPNSCPRIDLFRFLNFTILTRSLYGTVLERLRFLDTIHLDLGCCLGQYLRRLAEDIFPFQ